MLVELGGLWGSSIMESLWTVDELCARLKLARSTVYDWTHQQWIPHVKLGGGVIRFRPEEIAAWLTQQAKPGRARRVPATEA
jgi:excisionase family DNA binding protein